MANEGAESQPKESAEPDHESLRVVYQEVCKSHAGIADFRAKLLAFLPIASGSGVFAFLVEFRDHRQLLAPIGLFGSVVTLGLLAYELRGIQDCTMLRARAMRLEDALHIRPGEGQFGQGRGKLGGMADEVGAAWIVYTAVIASWGFIAVIGFTAVARDRPWLLVGAGGVVVAYVGIVCFAVISKYDRWIHVELRKVMLERLAKLG